MDTLRLTCGKARFRLVDALILISVAALTASILFAWQDITRSAAEQTRTLQILEQRITGMERRGSSTVIFHMPQVDGTPYVNFDMKGFEDLAIVPPTQAQRTTAGGATPTRSGGSKRRD